MILQSIISFLLGIFSGVVTGLVPGLHVNLVAVLVVESSFLKSLPVNILLIYLVALSLTHTFLDFIPAIYFGAPSEDTIPGMLIGHKFLLKGQAHAAIDLTAKGSILAVFSLIFVVPFMLIFLPKTYIFIQRIIPLILFWVLILMIFSRKEKKMQTLLIILLAGTLGAISLNLEINQPILPLLTGLFSTSTLLFSIKNKASPPKQKTGTFYLSKKEFFKPAFLTILISPLFSLLPGLGSSQAAIISQKLFRTKTKKQYLILLGSINTLVLSISFLTVYLLNKTRTGAAAAINQITSIGSEELKLIFIVIFISGIISFFLTKFISKKIAKNLIKINYQKISYFIIFLTTFLIFFVSNFKGLILLLASTSLGLLCQNLGQRKSNLMASIMIPTMIYYLI